MGKSRTNIFSRSRKENEKNAAAVVKDVDVDKKRRGSSNNNNEASNVEKVVEVADSKADKKKSRDSRKSAAKQKSENNRSLRRMKKRGVVRQMFEIIPKEVRKSSNKPQKSEKKVEAESEYDIPSELYPGPSVSPAQKAENLIEDNSDDNEDDGEDIYESRKLLIRQMQGLIAKEVHGSCSEYDSWSDLEENFALAYEPIPLNIHMETWRRMSKKDILKTVRSKKMKKEFEYMSRSEILGKIEMMQKSAHYLSVKFGVDHLLPTMSASDPDLSRKPERPKIKKIRAQVHHNHPVLKDVNGNRPVTPADDASVVTDFSVGVPDYVSRTEILKFYDTNQQQRSQAAAPPPLPPPAQNLRQKSAAKPVKEVRPEFVPPPPPVFHKQLSKSKKAQNVARVHDSWSSRASSILNNPESIYVSRHELIQQINGAPATTKHSGAKSGKPRIHDSWSSRASSILAKGDEEPAYMSRAEMLEKLAVFNNLGGHYKPASGRISSTSGENDDEDDGNESTASTVRNVVLVKKTPLEDEKSRKAEEPKVLNERDKFEDDPQPEILSIVDFSDACSCSSCNTYSDCSCCDHSNSDSSLETIVNGRFSSDAEKGKKIFLGK